MNGKPKIPISDSDREASKLAKQALRQEVPTSVQLLDLTLRLRRIEAFLNSRYNF